MKKGILVFLAIAAAFVFSTDTMAAKKKKKEVSTTKEKSDTDFKVNIASVQFIKGLKVVNNMYFNVGNRQMEGLYLTFFGECPDKTISFSGGNIESAIADNGDSLIIPSANFTDQEQYFVMDQPYNFMYAYSPGDNRFSFDLMLALPNEGVKTIKELSGTLEYESAENAKEVEITFTDLTKGAKGDKYDAEIQQVNTQESMGHAYSNISIMMSVPSNKVKSMKAVDENGLDSGLKYFPQRMANFNNGNKKMRAQMSNQPAQKYYFFLNGQGGLPERGKIVAEIYEDTKQYEVPFKLNDIPLVMYK